MKTCQHFSFAISILCSFYVLTFATENISCSLLKMVPTPYSYNGTDLVNFPLSCQVNKEPPSAIDIISLMAKGNVTVDTDEYIYVDLHVNCSKPMRIGFLHVTHWNKKIILTVRFQDCVVNWTDVNAIGLSAYLIHATFTYVQTMPEKLDRISHDDGQLLGLRDIIQVSIGINKNLVQDVIRIEEILPVIPSVGDLVLMCHNEKLDPVSCGDDASHKIQFNMTWLKTNYCQLQSLILFGVVPSDNNSSLDFPWNNDTRYLPLNLSRSVFQQKLYTTDVTSLTELNTFRRLLDVSYTGLSLSRICPVRGNLDKITLNTLRMDTEFPDDCFSASSNVSTMNLNIATFKNLTRNIFRNMSQLHSLSIVRSGLSEIEMGSFDDLDSLKFLNLDYNNLAYIKAGLFSNLTSLEVLYLHGNRITRVEPHSLPEFSRNLRFVDLRWNSLIEPVSDCFKLAKLGICDMDSNLIKLDNLSNWLNDEFNPVALSIVEPYAYNGQPLGHFDEGVSHETDQTRWSLRNNSSGNETFSIPFRINWSSFEKLQFATFISWAQINLENNNIQCDCSLYEMKKWFDTKEFLETLELAKYSGVLLASPSNFKSWECLVAAPWLLGYDKTPFLTMPLDNYLCAFDETDPMCPDDCLCYTRPEQGAYVVDCEGRGLRAFPAYLPIPPNNMPLYVSLAKNFITSFPVYSNTIVQSLHSSVEEKEPYAWLHYVTHLDVQHNEIQYEVENFINKLNGDKIKVLKLAYNAITKFPKTITLLNANFTISGNRLVCCNANWMKDWLREKSDTIELSLSLTCTGHNQGLPLVEMMDYQFECPNPSQIRFVSFIVLIPIFMVPLICWFHLEEIKILVFEKLGIKLRWKKMPRDADKTYDAVLTCADQDYEWCEQTLLPHLEESYKYKIFFKNRDGGIGVCTGPERTESLVKSHRAIVVLSNSFISDPDCMTFFSEARSYTTDKRFVLVIKLEHLRLDPEVEEHQIIVNCLRTNFFVDIKMNRCLARLCYWMPDRQARVLPTITENLPQGLDDCGHHTCSYSEFDTHDHSPLIV